MKKAILVCIIVFVSTVCTTTSMASLIITTPSGVGFDNQAANMPPSYNSQSPASSSGNLSILSPRCSAPVILEAGGTFTIWFAADPFTSVYAYISTAYEPVVDTYWLSLQSVHIQEGNWYVNASVSESVASELYNLTLLLDNNGMLLTTTQPRAVSISHITNNFTFIHLTDFHVGDPRGFSVSISQTLGYKSVLRCISEVNLLHPDFVVISGDLVFGQLYPREYAHEYSKLYEMLQRFDVPTYIVPGNHDSYRRPGEDGQAIWKQYFGPLYYSFNYGPFHFVAVNSYDLPARNRWAVGPIAGYWGGSIQDEQLTWISSDLNQSSNATLTFMFMHHNPLWDTRNDSLFHNHDYMNRQQILDLINQHGVDMVLAGHVHYDSVNIVNGTTFITTTTPESEIRTADGYWGYRMIRVENGTIVSYNYRDPYYSIPSYHLQVKFPTNQKAVVTNDLDTKVTVLLHFVLSDATYTTNVGTILMQRSDNTLKEIYMQLPVANNSQVTVKVTRVLGDQEASSLGQLG
ncbi:MAG TPA: metallophosphoesterase [Candidatus Thermoplasmatota archaeon]|nr:metallophosphoesterase [Candidatus Thermoplasmatota archaeon]